MNIDRINPSVTHQNTKINKSSAKAKPSKTGMVQDKFTQSGSMNMVSSGSQDAGKVFSAKGANAVFSKLESKVEKVWEFDLQDPGDLPHYEPVIRDDGIYINAAGHTTKIDFDGNEVWKVETGGSGYSQPAFDSKGNVYVSTGDEQKELICLNPAGDEKWRASTGERGCSHTPLITPDDKIILSTDNRELRFYDNNGKCTWSAANKAMHSVQPFLDKNGILHITDTYQDFKTWKQPYFIVNTRKPSLRKKGEIESLKSVLIDDDGNSYTFTDDKFRAKDINGKEMWAIDLPGETTSSEAKMGPDGKMYVRVREHAILCVDPKTGKENWRLENPIKHEGLSGDYAWGKDGTFYVTGSGGNWKLYSVKPDGSARWTNKDNKHIANVKVGKDGTIFTGGEGYPIKSFNPKTGVKQWTTDFELSYGDNNYHVLDNNEIVASTRDGKIVKLKHTTKEQQLRETADNMSKEEGSETPAPTIEETAEWVEIGGVRLKKNR